MRDLYLTQNAPKLLHIAIFRIRNSVVLLARVTTKLVKGVNAPPITRNYIYQKVVFVFR
jgi:hypothetical protein